MSALIRGLCCAAVLSLTGCGKEAGRLSFAVPTTVSSTVTLRSGEVDFWTDLDVTYAAPQDLQYRIDLLQGGRAVASAACDPLGPKSIRLGWVSIAAGNARKERGRGKMQCSASLPASGSTTILATLQRSDPASSLILNKADLVIKQ